MLLTLLSATNFCSRRPRPAAAQGRALSLTGLEILTTGLLLYEAAEWHIYIHTYIYIYIYIYLFITFFGLWAPVILPKVICLFYAGVTQQPRGTYLNLAS